MSLSPTQIERIAQLARLDLSAAEIPVYADSLSRIVALVGQLDSAVTDGTEPMAHPLPGLVQRLRVDEPREADRHEAYQRNAPAVQAGLYVVPKVIE